MTGSSVDGNSVGGNELAVDESLRDPHAPLRVAPSSEFSDLYVSRVAKKLPESTALQNALETLDLLQRTYLAQQAQQNVLDKLLHIETRAELEIAATASGDALTTQRTSREELGAATHARTQLVERIAATAQVIEAAKRRVVELDSSHDAFERDVAAKTKALHALQRRNAQRKASVQMTTALLVNDEDDCNRALEHQTQRIRELQQKQLRLENKEIDVATLVKQTSDKMQDVVTRNDVRSKDVEAQQRQVDYYLLQRMQQWFTDMMRITAQLASIAVTHVSNEFLEVTVCETHTLRLFYDATAMRVRHVELAQHDVAADDLVALVLRDNNLQFFLCEYRRRIIAVCR